MLSTTGMFRKLERIRMDTFYRRTREMDVTPVEIGFLMFGLALIYASLRV